MRAKRGQTLSVEQARVEDYLAGLETDAGIRAGRSAAGGLGQDRGGHLNRRRRRSRSFRAIRRRWLGIWRPDGIHIERVTLVDLFPQTYHFETVVRLTRP